MNKKKQIFLAFWNVLQLTMGQNDEKIDMKLVIAWFQHTKSLMDINFQQLYEQNTSLKEIIIKLDTKVEELSKSRHDLTEAVSAKKSSTFNTPIFNAPTLNAPMAHVSRFSIYRPENQNVNEVDISKDKNQSKMSEAPSSNNLTKNKHNQVLNSISEKVTNTKAKNISHNANNNVRETQWQKPKNDVRKDKLAAKMLQKSFAKTVGTGDFEGLGAVDRPYCIQIKRVPNELGMDLIEDFFKNKIKLKYKDFKMLDLPHSHFKAYTLTINFVDKKIINNKNDWPKGWVVQSFYPPKLISQTNNNSFQFGGPNRNYN